MTVYLLAPFATDAGRVVHHDAWGRAEHSQLRASDYAHTHPGTIPLTMEHDEPWQLGQVAHLERTRGRLWAFAELNANGHDVVTSTDTPWYLTASVRAVAYEDHGVTIHIGARIRHIGITTTPAARGLDPIVIGEAFPHRRASLLLEDTWNRGVDAARKRAELARIHGHHRANTIEIHDPELEQQRTRAATNPKPSGSRKPLITPLLYYRDEPVFTVAELRSHGLDVNDIGDLIDPRTRRVIIEALLP